MIGPRGELARAEFFRRPHELADRRADRSAALPRSNPLQQQAASATVEPLTGNRIQVTFDQPQYGVAPGQAVVCYDGEKVLGGGWIES